MRQMALKDGNLLLEGSPSAITIISFHVCKLDKILLKSNKILLWVQCDCDTLASDQNSGSVDLSWFTISFALMARSDTEDLIRAAIFHSVLQTKSFRHLSNATAIMPAVCALEWQMHAESCERLRNSYAQSKHAKITLLQEEMGRKLCTISCIDRMCLQMVIFHAYCELADALAVNSSHMPNSRISETSS